jgi:hypothetical protein
MFQQPGDNIVGRRLQEEREKPHESWSWGISNQSWRLFAFCLFWVGSKALHPIIVWIEWLIWLGTMFWTPWIKTQYHSVRHKSNTNLPRLPRLNMEWADPPLIYLWLMFGVETCVWAAQWVLPHFCKREPEIVENNLANSWSKYDFSCSKHE